MATLQPLLPSKLPAGAPSVFPPISDPAAPPIAQAAMGGGLHSLLGIPSPTLPSVKENPGISAVSTDPLITRKDALEADLYNRTQPKPAATTTLGKIGHVASNIGNALGDIFAPSTMALIPGTDLHNERIEARDKHDLDQISALQTQEAGREQTEANTDYLKQKPAIEQSKIDQRQQAVRDRVSQQAAKNGQVVTWDEDGNPTYADDPELLAHAAQQAQIEQRDAEAELAHAKRDPSDPYYQQVERKVAVARANAIAAQVRANAYMGNYKERAYNVGLDGQTLPGAPQITDESGNTTTVGTANAPQAVKAQSNAAQFGDVNGALDNLEAKAKALVQSGGRLNSPSVVYALQHIGAGTPSQIIESINKANLTPQERDYVISNLAAHENVQALRKSAGGTATDSSVAKLDALLPNGTTPDIDYLLNQTGQIRQTAQRLGKGVTTVQGGLKVDTGKPHASSGVLRARDPQGVLHEAPAGTPLPQGWKLEK